MDTLRAFIELTVADFNISVGVFVFLIVFVIFSQICAMMSMAFMAIIKANTYNSKRVSKGLGLFGLGYLGSMVVTIIVFACVLGISGNISQLMATQMSQEAIITMLVTCVVLYLTYAVFFYWICNKIFNKGVNVD